LHFSLCSLFAAASGAKKVLAFEVSKMMCDVAISVISEYNFESNIILLNKMSTDHVSKADDAKLDLVVMEIFDCGLFGEGVVPTVKHALAQPMNHSLKQQNPGKLKPKVIPKSARLFATLIECCEIRKHSWSCPSLLDFHMNSVVLLGKMDPGDSSEQPYTTENLSSIKGGYRCLSKPVQVLEINFDSIEELNQLTEKDFFVAIPVNENGQLDAIVTWFELQLDDDIVLTSSPDAKSCWEQAVYHIQLGDFETTYLPNLHVFTGSSVELQCRCKEQFLQIFTHRIHAPSCTSLSVSSAMESDLDVFTDSQRGLFARNPGSYIGKQSRVTEDGVVYSGHCSKPPTSTSKSGLKIEDKGHVDEYGAFQGEGGKWLASNKPVEITSTRPTNSNNGISISPRESLFGHMDDEGGQGSCTCDDRQLSSIESQSWSRTYVPVNRRKVARINDRLYYELYRKAISEVIAESFKSRSHLDLLFLCDDISLLPLLVNNKENINVDVLCTNVENFTIMEKVASENRYNLEHYRFLNQSLPEVICTGKKYDVIIMEVVEENGMLCQSLFNDLILIRTFLLKSGGRLIPESLTMIGRIIESSTIENDSFVSDSSVTLGYDIGKFLNRYQVSTQPDVNMLNLPGKYLTDDFKILLIDLTEGGTDEEIVKLKAPRNSKLDVKIRESGHLSAVGYWFQIHLTDNVLLSTRADSQTHWNQSLVVVKERVFVKTGDSLILDIILNRGNLHIVRCYFADK